MDSMFAEIQPVAERFRNYCAVVASVLGHLALLAAILLHQQPPIELIPLSLANGSGTQSYRIIYAPPDGRDSVAEEKITLARSKPALRRRPKASVSKPAPDHLQVPVEAKAADQNARAGSALGTMIDGPIEG